MLKRKIIKIDEQKCNGCGKCIPNCPEGAIQIIDRKARLISDLFCDGLGACIGYCPQGAITIEERDAEDYDEKKVMQNIVKQGKNVVKAHLEHLKSHGQKDYLQQALIFLKENKLAVPELSHGQGSCPGSRVMDFRSRQDALAEKPSSIRESELKTWPIQLNLVPAVAPFLNNADLLIAADCVGFAYADFHRDLLKGRVLLVSCPKLDDTQVYREKLSQIVKNNNVKSITYAHMEVPCCFGLVGIIKEAIGESGKSVSFKEIVISIQGEKLS